MIVTNFPGKWTKNMKVSAVSDHLLEHNCTIDFDLTDIFTSDFCKFNLSVNESLLIKLDNPLLNITTKSFLFESLD